MEIEEVTALENRIIELNKHLTDAKFKLERDTPIAKVAGMKQHLNNLDRQLDKLYQSSSSLTHTLSYFGIGRGGEYFPLL